MVVAAGGSLEERRMDYLNIEAIATRVSGAGTESMRAIETVAAPPRASTKVSSAGSSAIRRPLRRVGLGMMASGVLLALGTVYAQLARALPLTELPGDFRAIPAIILLGVGMLVLIAEKWHREPNHGPLARGAARVPPAARLREPASEL
jgi:hypothetical protein